MEQRCPVCDGCGTVPQRFYHDDDGIEIRNGRERCRRCNGTGTISVGSWGIPSYQPYPTWPYPSWPYGTQIICGGRLQQ